MRSGTGNFKQLRHFTALAAGLLVLAGCTGVTPRPQAGSATQPLARVELALPDAEHDLMAQLLTGELALTRNDLAAAAASYARAARLGNDPEVAERATGLAIAVHDGAAARAALARWQQLGASPAALASARAQLALDEGDGARAQRELEALLATDGDDAWREFGRVLVGARDQAQAGRLLEALATPARLPADYHAWLAMSELGERLGRHAYAQMLAGTAAARFPNAEVLTWAARAKAQAGDAAGARALLARALAKTPRDAGLRLTYASLLVQSGQRVEALKLLERGPQNADTFAMRAGLVAASNDTRGLAALYREIQHARPEVREASAFLLGQLAEMQDRDDEALAWYDAVDEDDPHAFEADLRSAVLLHKTAHRDEAHQLLQDLEVHYADQPERARQAWQMDAGLYLDERDYAAAEAVFDRALQALPDDTEILYGRGIARAEAGRVDAAVADFQRVLQLKPDDVDASNALGYTLADANRDLPEAERLIGVARAAKPDDPAIADSWGWLQYRLGNLEQAASALAGAWRERKDADVGVHLGEVLWRQGHRADAERVFGEVRKLDPDNFNLAETLKRLQP